MKEYITEGADKSRKKLKQYDIHGKPFVFVEPFKNEINLDYIKKTIETLTPDFFFDNVDSFLVGYADEFFKGDREYNAMFKDGAIYLSPDQDNEKDLLDDILHELAHAVEEKNEEEIYGDGRLEREFLAKRNTLYHLLDDENYDLEDYENPEYDYKFDQHLYKGIGYDKLRTISSGLFYSPYAITALREYWANGFENYLLGNRNKLKELSPVLYNKIDLLFDF